MNHTSPPTAPTAALRTPPARPLWVMLFALTTAFALSQAYRTIATIMAAPLQADFHLDAEALGLFAGAFHFASARCSCSWESASICTAFAAPC